MKYLLKSEELLMFIISTELMFSINNNILIYLLLLFTPDIGMIGYLINPKIGSITYNALHLKTVSVTIIILSLLLHNYTVLYLGLLLFTHSSMDRIVGYGLKYPDKFKHTHLD